MGGTHSFPTFIEEELEEELAEKLAKKYAKKLAENVCCGLCCGPFVLHVVLSMAGKNFRVSHTLATEPQLASNIFPIFERFIPYFS